MKKKTYSTPVTERVHIATMSHLLNWSHREMKVTTAMRQRQNRTSALTTKMTFLTTKSSYLIGRSTCGKTDTGYALTTKRHHQCPA